QLLFQRTLLFGDLLLADLQLLLQIGPTHPATEEPEAQADQSLAHGENTLPNEMNRAQAGHQNQTRQVNAGQNDRRAFAEGETQLVAAHLVADPSAGSLAIKEARPVAQEPMLQTEQTGAG